MVGKAMLTAETSKGVRKAASVVINKATLRIPLSLNLNTHRGFAYSWLVIYLKHTTLVDYE